MRLEGWGGPWFETRCFAALLTMRPGKCRGYGSRPPPIKSGVGRDDSVETDPFSPQFSFTLACINRTAGLALNAPIG